MPNRLAQSNSPYLLQHKDNPVDWFPWGPEALGLAKRENKPIFLSIGYAACHWCHVMAHESFEDTQTAAYMNAHFVNIKVDREERPDLDGIYMNAVVALTGSGGWPLSAFLTPDGKPFLGGTYFPPEPRHQLPSFRQVLEHVHGLWEQDREKVFDAGKQLQEHLKHSPASRSVQLEPSLLNDAVLALAQAYEWNNGGWGHAPKFPQPMTIDFLLARATKGDKLAEDMAVHALRAMARGGMYDVVGGGFARYSVDDSWLVPHFEKMLYDNAQLARTYLHGYIVTQDLTYRHVCEQTLDFVARELRNEQGGFLSSLDADSEGEEGKYYVWSFHDFKDAASETETRALLIDAFGISEGGNFEGHNILQRVKTDEALAQDHDLEITTVSAKLASGLQAMFTARQRRVRPGTDDKVLTSWNGLMLVAYAEAGRYLGRQDYTDIARANADFLLRELVRGGRLLRSWRGGHAEHNGYLEDHAALILGLLALYQTDPEPRWYAAVLQLANEMLAHFSDPSVGFFDTRDDHEALITRPKDTQDNATPSGSALAATALLQLAAFSGNSEWRQKGENAIGSVLASAARYPTAFAQWLFAASFALAEGKEIALVGDEERKLTSLIWNQWRPFDVVASSNLPLPEGAPELLKDRPQKDGKATAYVCRGFVCNLPVNNPDELANQLAA